MTATLSSFLHFALPVPQLPPTSRLLQPPEQVGQVSPELHLPNLKESTEYRSPEYRFDESFPECEALLYPSSEQKRDAPTSLSQK